jgi:hypothetical protein
LWGVDAKWLGDWKGRLAKEIGTERSNQRWFTQEKCHELIPQKWLGHRLLFSMNKGMYYVPNM